MGIPQKAHSTIFAVFCFSALSGALIAQQTQQSGPDPYNPRSGVVPPTNRNTATPSLIDMGYGTDQGNVGPFVTMADKQFAQRTAQRAMMEMQLAEAALRKSDNESVKQVGRRVMDDYTRWTPILEKISERANITLPAQLDGKHKAEVDKVTALEGAQFDQAFLKEMVRLQNRALTITHYETDHAGVTAFRSWSGKIVPDIQDHLHLAKQGLSGEQVAAKK